MDFLIFAGALSILVLVHEVGHYLAAKAVGVKVEEFGLGLPPRIFGKKIGETIWSINWLPIGGFCKLFGEDPTEKIIKKNKGRSFADKNPWQKGLVVVGGVVMNVVLAVVIFSVVYSILGIPVETSRVKIVGVAKGSPAEEAGLKEGDWVMKVGERAVTKPEEMTEEVGKYKGKEIELIINGGDGQARPVQILVREKPLEGEGGLGVAISNTEMVKLKWYEFYRGIGAGFKEAYYWGKVIGDGVGRMVAGLFTGQPPRDVSGVIGMYQATTNIKKNQGMLAVVHFFGVVSVNLAVVNILPFPALDGGRIIFVIYEMIRKKRANEKFEALVNNVGMAVLLTLILLITAGDVMRVIGK